MHSPKSSVLTCHYIMWIPDNSCSVRNDSFITITLNYLCRNDYSRCTKDFRFQKPLYKLRPNGFHFIVDLTDDILNADFFCLDCITFDPFCCVCITYSIYYCVFMGGHCHQSRPECSTTWNIHVSTRLMIFGSKNLHVPLLPAAYHIFHVGQICIPKLHTCGAWSGREGGSEWVGRGVLEEFTVQLNVIDSFCFSHLRRKTLLRMVEPW